MSAESGRRRRRSDRSRERFQGGDFLLGLARKEKIKHPGKKALVRIHFYWTRIFLVLVALAFIGWLTAGAALYFFYKEYRGYEEVSYFKTLFLPLRLEQHRKEMGDSFIAKGMRELDAGQFRSGFHHLRVGLRRSPANAQARVALARIFHSPGFGDNRLALEVLEGGFDFHDQDDGVFGAEYLGFLFYLLGLEQEDERRIALAETLLEKVQSPDLRLFLQLQAFHAEVELGRFKAAITRFRRNDLHRRPEGIRVLGLLFQKAGQQQIARSILERGSEKFPENGGLAESFYAMLKENEQWEDLLGHTGFRLIIRPGDTVAGVARLYALDGIGRLAEVPPAVEDLFDRGPPAEIGLRVVEFAYDRKRPEIAARAKAHLQEAGLFNESHAVVIALTFIRGGRAREALDDLQSFEDGAAITRRPALIAGARAAALRNLGDETAALVEFQRFIEAGEHPSGIYTRYADAFAEQGFRDYTYRTLLTGIQYHPHDQEILRRLLLDFDREDPVGSTFANRTKKLLDGRVPGHEVLETARQELVSDRYLFAPNQKVLVARMDQLIKQGRDLKFSNVVTTSGVRINDRNQQAQEPEQD